MKLSVYDKVDIAEDSIRSGEPDAQKLYEAKMETADIDNGLELIGVHLEAYDGLHKDKELTVARMNQFFDEMLPAILRDLEKLRERLY